MYYINIVIDLIITNNKKLNIMNKNINNEQIKDIENMISTKKTNMETALSYYKIVRNEEEENAVYSDAIPYTKFKEPTNRIEFIKKWHNNLTAMAILDYYVARLDYEEATKLELIIY